MLNKHNVLGEVNRRRLMLGMAAASLSACANSSAKQLALPLESAPDPLGHFRLPYEAGAKLWGQHLHKPSLAKNPQILALSGGGEDGAFGAGALNGWSATNRRPAFDLVTGVSTGALIAPFAFLGTEYDDDLRRIFTEHNAKDIMRFRGINVVHGNALYDTGPLVELIRKFTPNTLLSAIARRHDAGARLFMVTSNLETARAMVWDMGEIAKAGNYALFRAVMRASSALPGLFPPVTIRYKSGGKTYRETHFDGGVHMQILATPKAAFAAPRRISGGGHLYLLINNTLAPAPQTVSRTPLAISRQAVTTMVRSSATASVSTARHLARKNNLVFSVACVNSDVGVEYDPGDRFSAKYMNALFQHGYNRAVEDQLWSA